MEGWIICFILGVFIGALFGHFRDLDRERGLRDRVKVLENQKAALTKCKKRLEKQLEDSELE